VAGGLAAALGAASVVVGLATGDPAAFLGGAGSLLAGYAVSRAGASMPM
jgi:hypothetical protein